MKMDIEVYKWTPLRCTSLEEKGLHWTTSRCKMCMPSVSKVIDYLFSHGVASYMFSGENIKVMLECAIKQGCFSPHKRITLSYFFSYKTQFLSFPNSPKNQDLSYKTDLDLWDCLGRVKFIA